MIGEEGATCPCEWTWPQVPPNWCGELSLRVDFDALVSSSLLDLGCLIFVAKSLFEKSLKVIRLASWFSIRDWSSSWLVYGQVWDWLWVLSCCGQGARFATLADRSSESTCMIPQSACTAQKERDWALYCRFWVILWSKKCANANPIWKPLQIDLSDQLACRLS